jgi:hypothetical protein
MIFSKYLDGQYINLGGYNGYYKIVGYLGLYFMVTLNHSQHLDNKPLSCLSIPYLLTGSQCILALEDYEMSILLNTKHVTRLVV